MDEILERFQQLLASAAPASGDASCELLLAQLPAEAARCFRLCAIPHQFDPQILALLASDIAEPDREQIYRRITGLSLVNIRDGGMALHDTVRAYLFGKWLAENGPDFRAASERLRVYFDALHRELEAPTQHEALHSRMFHWIGADQSAGMEEFERLCREERRAWRLSGCASLISLVHEYDPILTQASTGILTYHEGKLAADRNQRSEAEAHFRDVLANNAVAPKMHIKCLDRLGILYTSERRWNQAIEVLDRAIETARRIGEEAPIPMLLHDLAVAWRVRDRGRSRELIEEAIPLARSQSNLLCLATCYNSLGTLHRNSREYREAIAAYQKSLEYLEQSGDRFRRSAVYNNLGDVYAELSDWPSSEKYFSMSLDVSREAADTFAQARTLTNLIPVYLNMKRDDDAITAARTASSYFTALNDPFDAANPVLRTARIYRSAGRFEAAMDAYSEARELYLKGGDHQSAANVEHERNTVHRPVRLPWWAWVCLAAVILLCVLLVAFMVWAEARS